MLLFLVGVVSASVFGTLGWLFASRTAQTSQRLVELDLASARAMLASREERLRQAMLQLERVEQALRVAETGLATERALAAERTQTLRLELEATSRKLVEEGRASLLEVSQRGVEAVVAPLRERLREFSEKVDHAYEVDAKDRGALLEKLRGLQEAQNRLHADANALAAALTGESRAQGDWGELVLESLLATAGLTEGREYELQVDHRTEDGQHRRPDALIYLPPDRALIVDSKCSLSAFIASTRTPDDDEREQALEAHVHALRMHIRALSQKDYQQLLGNRTLDLVLLFVPNEAAFHAAVARDLNLYEDAARQRVILTSPATLLPTLQVVSHVWRTERQAHNAQRIAAEAGRLIEKLAMAMESFHEVGERLHRAQSAFDEARGRLVTGRGNALQLARRVMDLGARPPHPERLTTIAERLDAELTSPDEEQLDLLPEGA
ncbi:MAG: DNA recombination protein RmuC [Myxococcaceae bacterium]